MPAGAAGEPWVGDNPALAIPRPWHEFVGLWFMCRGEAGIAHWPDAGGIGDQAAWIVDAFATLAGVAAKWDAEDRQARGQP